MGASTSLLDVPALRKEIVSRRDTKAAFHRSAVLCNETPQPGDGNTRPVDTIDAETLWTMLMEQSLDGDCAAYHRLLSLLTTTLRRAFRGRSESVGVDAEDVVQEVLIALHLKRNTWVRGTPVAPWVTAIARNKLVDAHRRRGRRPEISIENVVETLRGDGEDDDGRSLDIERAMAGLPTRQRQVLQAVSLEGHSAREAAVQLDMTEGAVRVTLHRGLKSLATLFREVLHED